jgi:hypothetical protein
MQDRLQHRAHRTLAVGAAHGDDWKCRCEAERVADPGNAIQSESDGFRMQALDVR